MTDIRLIAPLLERGGYRAQINEVVGDHNWQSPLHLAASNASLETCQLLVRNGANLLQLDFHGNRSLDLCARSDKECFLYLDKQTHLAAMYRERFVMKHDRKGGGGQHHIEFAYDDTTKSNVSQPARASPVVFELNAYDSFRRL